MFGFIKRIGRPFMAIGRKMGEIFNLGKKGQAQGVLREQVLNNTANKFIDIPKYYSGGGSTGLPKGSYLRPYDELNKAGGYVGNVSSYIGN
jgi:hypothetical protein